MENDMSTKQLNEQVLLIKGEIIKAIPTGVSFAAIIIALAQLVIEFQKQSLEDE